jgi:hypothetical protein
MRPHRLAVDHGCDEAGLNGELRNLEHGINQLAETDRWIGTARPQRPTR